MRSPSLPAKINKKIGQAMGDWKMLADGDRVLVAVSGGIDSLATAWVLKMWRDKAPVDYELEAVHVDNGFWKQDLGARSPATLIAEQLRRLQIPFCSVAGWEIEGERTCFSCARNRRSQLFELARQKGCTKLALGHHKDDLVETFFINALFGGNISTMVPKQELFAGRLSLIRILAYLDKEEVKTIAGLAGLQPVPSYCPIGEDSRRETVRNLLERIYVDIPGAKGSLFSALGNVREGYML
ncbi:MAG: tRNA 2-thiocytidine biosynthesis protein TtcA [Desulfofustis sp.]|nr:tRNA 2-thiocytidine biosynthesis protein TtcA [Desulfofustis sp.]